MNLMRALRPTAVPIVLLASIVLILAVVYNAAVQEDAYITFRVVDNFVNGQGLRWNLHERVQSYTNPLWMFLHIPFYAIFPNIFFITLLLGIICTEMTLLLSFTTFKQSPFSTICLFILPLTLSRTFVEYSTSGFENPLEHALFAWFGWALFFAKPKHYWLHLSLATSLSMVNRLDTLILFAPVWGYLVYTHRKTVDWKQVALGWLPIVAWELFSLFYYGFLFPNTKYAKLHTGIGEMEYLRLGFSYLLNLIAVDFISALLLMVAVGSIPFLYRRYKKDRQERTGLFLCVALGVLAYTAYVVIVGGTYLSGRMLSLQIFASAWLVLGWYGQSLRHRNLIILAVALCALKLFYPPYATIVAVCPQCTVGVDSIDAEVKDGFRNYLAGKVKLAEPGSLHSPYDVHIEWSMGKWGYEMERKVKIVDGFALCDPLLARLPISAPHIITMGMTPRAFPAGYLEAVKSGNTDQMDPDLAAYYRKLRLIISGDLFSGERLLEIVKFNLGAYEYLRELYIEKAIPPKKQVAMRD